MSLSLCADQYLLMLADPGQIAGITRFAQDPGMSWAVGRARRFRAIRGSAEEMLALQPDLVLTSGFGSPGALAVLASRKVRVVDLPWDNDLAGIEQTVRKVAELLGHPDRGDMLIAAMRRRLAAIGPSPGAGRVAAYYQRRGYLTGQGTLIDDMMRRVGLSNLAARLGRPMLSRLSLEEMAMARPDFLIVDRNGAVRDQGSEMLEHPILKRAVPAARWLRVPEALTTCGGPSYPDAVRTLADAVRRADEDR